MYFWSKRRKLFFVLLFLFFIFAGVCAGNGLVSSRMLLSMSFCSSYESLTAGLTENKHLDVEKAVRFNGSAVPYVYENNCFYISQDMDTEAWSGYFSVPYGFGVYFLEDEMWRDKKQAIASGHVFSMLVQMGEEYREVGLVVSGLPVMSLTELDDTEGLQELILLSGEEKDSYEGYCQSHIRGQTSKSYPKKGYRVELCDENFQKVKVPLLGLRTDDDWILNAMYTDSSKVREKLAYQIWADMQEIRKTEEASSGITYIELIYDNCYYGLYGLMEPLDAKQLSMDETDRYYRKTDVTLPTEADFETEDGQEYIQGFRIKYPKAEEVTVEDWKLLQPYVENFYDRFHSAVGTEVDLAELEQIADVDNIIDYEILIAVLQGEDNIYKNMDYCLRYENGSYVMHIIPWDMDSSFGNKGVEVRLEESLKGVWTMLTCREFVVLYKADNERIENATRERWMDYRQHMLSNERLWQLTESYMDELVQSGAMARDSARWPECNNFTDLSVFHEYIRIHMDSLDAVFAQDDWWLYNAYLRNEEQWKSLE